MESVVVSTELLYTRKKRYYSINSPYNVDFWEEVKKRWLVFAILGALLLAVISPRVGAPGGKQPACSLLDHSRTHCTHLTMLYYNINAVNKYFYALAWFLAGLLRTEYLSYVPASLIYFGAGARLAPRAPRAPLPPHPAPPPRAPHLPRLPLSLALAAALHAHVAAPVLAVCAVTMFGDALHRPVVSGALLSSLGGGCAWLTLALSRRGAAPLVAAACYLASLVAAPLGVLLLCGRTSIPPLSDVVSTATATLVPFSLGAARRRPLAHQLAVDRAAALTLVYAECCTRLADAEGSLAVGDVLATLLVEVSWVAASAGACGAYARWWGARGARLIALAAVPKALDAGWGAAAACSAGALSRLPGVFAAPAQALLLAALHPQDPRDRDSDSDSGPE